MCRHIEQAEQRPGMPDKPMACQIECSAQIDPVMPDLLIESQGQKARCYSLRNTDVKFRVRLPRRGPGRVHGTGG